jgi:hypothetical protein
MGGRSEPVEHAMRQTAPGFYEARFPLESYGSYVLTALHTLEGRAVAESSSEVSNPYPPEYRSLTPNVAILEQATSVTGGLREPRPEDLFDPGGEKVTHHEELWPTLLMLALGLFLLDLLHRRVRIFDREFKSSAQKP